MPPIRVDIVKEQRRAERADRRQRPTKGSPVTRGNQVTEEERSSDPEHKPRCGDLSQLMQGENDLFHSIDDEVFETTKAALPQSPLRRD